MDTESPIREGQVLTGPLFSEPMRVEIMRIEGFFDRPDCYWLYVVTNCASTPELQEPVSNPARFPWHQVTKVQHYWLEVNTLTQPMQVREKTPPFGEKT